VSSSVGASFVVPVHNGARWLDHALAAILVENDGRPFEVLAVDDGSSDASPSILARYAAAGAIRIIQGPGRGAAAAINAGIREARHPLICQVDQDVILRPGWLRRLTHAVRSQDVGAAQGYYVTPADGSVWARVMGLDLEQRYGRIRGVTIDHVCTGNSVYRAEALRRVGLFDESLGYGYDNDMSYRLTAAGYRLVFCREAQSIHRWRNTMRGYVAQQYGVGYGRLDVVAKHRRRVLGDAVSGPSMILHAPLALAASGMLFAAGALGVVGGPWRPPAFGGGALLVALACERLVAGIQVSRRFQDLAGLGFVPVHLMRDVAWAFALVRWIADRLRGRSSRPSASMKRASLVSAPPQNGAVS
jgi:GT2 family glycosyltransferase